MGMHTINYKNDCWFLAKKKKHISSVYFYSNIITQQVLFMRVATIMQCVSWKKFVWEKKYICCSCVSFSMLFVYMYSFKRRCWQKERKKTALDLRNWSEHQISASAARPQRWGKQQMKFKQFFRLPSELSLMSQLVPWPDLCSVFSATK